MIKKRTQADCTFCNAPATRQIFDKLDFFSNKNKVESIQLLIYNRWGEIVFESENIDFGWDGTYKNRIAQDGIYTWELIFKNNSSSFTLTKIESKLMFSV